MIYVIALLLLGILVVLIAMYQNKDEFRNSTKKSIPKLYFKDNQAAFAYACENLSGNLAHKMAYVGIVDGAEIKDGTQQCVLRIAVNGGENYVFGFSNSNKVKLSKGNLVLWGLMDHVKFESNVNIIAAGAILATISPIHDVTTGKWDLKCDLT